MSGLAGDIFFLDDFALKVFDPRTASGTCISFDKAEFVRLVHEHHAKVGSLPASPVNKGAVHTTLYHTNLHTCFQQGSSPRCC